MTELAMGTETPAPTLSAQQLLTRTNRICIALAADSPATLFEKASAALASSSFLEFRLDYLPDPIAALPQLQAFHARHPSVISIATCRRVPDGGHFRGEPADELDILLGSARSGCRIVDLPLEAAESLPPAALTRLRSTGVALLLSHHDFAATPSLEPLLARALHFHPDFVKIVPTANTLSDNLPLLDLLARHVGTVNLVGISMGAAGLPSRILGIRSGSAFTFAAADDVGATAPGQITAHALQDTFHLETIDTATSVFGVAGHPLRHSLSPVMLNAAFRREYINAVYLPLETPDLQDLLRTVQSLPVHGLSITMPFKEQILPFLDRIDPLCRRIGACNTVHRSPDGKLSGFNTDVFGITTPLLKRLGTLRGAKTLVLGAGGAARAAVFGLREQGADVFLHNRTPAAADRLADESSSRTLPREALRSSTFDVIVNATPLGMLGHTSHSPLAPEELRGGLVFDLVYNPLETPLLRLATELGLPVLSGYEMFVYQGARQFEIWTGQPAPERDMLRTVLHALRSRSTPPSEPATVPAPHQISGEE